MSGDKDPKFLQIKRGNKKPTRSVPREEYPTHRHTHTHTHPPTQNASHQVVEGPRREIIGFSTGATVIIRITWAVGSRRRPTSPAGRVATAEIVDDGSELPLQRHHQGALLVDDGRQFGYFGLCRREQNRNQTNQKSSLPGEKSRTETYQYRDINDHRLFTVRSAR